MQNKLLHFYFILVRLQSKDKHIASGEKMKEKRILPSWNKQVYIKMIEKDMTVPELAEKMKWTRQYTSAILNGRVYHKEAVERISQYFDIEMPQNSTLFRIINTNT